MLEPPFSQTITFTPFSNPPPLSPPASDHYCSSKAIWWYLPSRIVIYASANTGFTFNFASRKPIIWDRQRCKIGRFLSFFACTNFKYFKYISKMDDPSLVCLLTIIITKFISVLTMCSGSPKQRAWGRAAQFHALSMARTGETCNPYNLLIMLSKT
jgi:hypothetical protein